jgi:hypothetical protein
MAVEKSLVRFFAIDKTIAGVGVLVTERQILTCAHVIDRVLLRDKADRVRKPDRDVVIPFDFPLVAAGKKCQARITRWSPVKDDDVATLLVDEDVELPSGISPTPLVPPHKEMWGKKVRAFGFPDKADDGVWAEGELRGPQAKGWVHIDQPNSTGYSITTGFSGGPIWDAERKGVVGIVVAADTRPDIKSSFMIPSTVLGTRLPFEQERGSIVWSLTFLRSNTLGALLNDLLELERHGLAEEECQRVKIVLGRLANSASDIGETAFWGGMIHEDLEEFEDLYATWNSHAGPEAPKHRRDTLRELRKARRRFADKAGQVRAVLSNELDEKLFDEVYSAIEEMCKKYPEKFLSLQKSARTFRKRKQASR